MVDSVPSDEDCGVLDGELTHGKRNENDSENFSDSDVIRILQKGEGHNRML